MAKTHEGLSKLQLRAAIVAVRPDLDDKDLRWDELVRLFDSEVASKTQTPKARSTTSTRDSSVKMKKSSPQVVKEKRGNQDVGDDVYKGMTKSELREKVISIRPDLSEKDMHIGQLVRLYEMEILNSESQSKTNEKKKKKVKFSTPEKGRMHAGMTKLELRKKLTEMRPNVDELDLPWDQLCGLYDSEIERLRSKMEVDEVVYVDVEDVIVVDEPREKRPIEHSPDEEPRQKISKRYHETVEEHDVIEESMRNTETVPSIQMSHPVRVLGDVSATRERESRRTRERGPRVQVEEPVRQVHAIPTLKRTRVAVRSQKQTNEETGVRSVMDSSDVVDGRPKVVSDTEEWKDVSSSQDNGNVYGGIFYIIGGILLLVMVVSLLLSGGSLPSPPASFCDSKSESTVGCVPCPIKGICEDGNMVSCEDDFFIVGESACAKCIPHGECKDGKIISCENGYELVGGSCVLVSQGIKVSNADFEIQANMIRNFLRVIKGRHECRPEEPSTVSEEKAREFFEKRNLPGANFEEVMKSIDEYVDVHDFSGEKVYESKEEGIQDAACYLESLFAQLCVIIHEHWIVILVSAFALVISMTVSYFCQIGD